MLDLADIRNYLDPVPERYAQPIRRGLRLLLQEIAAYPERGTVHGESTRLLGQEVRSRLLALYRVFYREHSGAPEVLAILHMARDASTILTERLQ